MISIEQLLNALPPNFQFYHLGEVKINSTPSPIQDPGAIAYRIYGELSAILILLFDRDLDHSIYSELGNIIVSQLSHRISTETGLELMVSSPQFLNADQLQRLNQSNCLKLSRSYGHFFQNSVIPLEAVILAATLEEIVYV